MEPKTPPLSEAGDIESPDSVSSGVEVDIMSEDEEQERPDSQLSLSRMLQEPPPSPSILEACKEGSPDSVSSSCQPENMSISVSAARSRPCSPQPSTSSGKTQPFVKLEKLTDQLLSGSAQSFRSSWADKRPWSPQLSPSCSSLLQERELQPFFDPYDETEDHIYARDLSMRRSPMDWQERASSPQPSTSSGGVPFIKQPFVQASNATAADSTDPDRSLSPENISTPWGNLRPWSPTPSTSSAAMMLELELMPVNMEAGGADGPTESIYARLAQNISVPAGFGQPRTWSQQPTKMSDVALKDSEIPFLSLADDLTGSMLPNTEFIDYSNVDRDISLPVKKRLRRWSKSQLLPTTKTEEASSMDSDAQNTSASPTTMNLRRWPSEQLTTPEQTQLEMQNLAEGDDATSASDLSGVAQNLSTTASEAKKRAWSPQPSTSKAGLMELKEKPLSAVIGSKGDSFSLSILKNIRAIEEKRKMQQLSPHLFSTPTPMQSVKAEEEKPADAGSSSAAQNISIPASETKKRPRSPQSPTSTEELMEVKEKPLLTIGSKGDSFSLSVLKNIRAIEEKRKMHQLSPRRFSTPTPMQSVKAEEEKPADAGSSSAAPNISIPASETKKRPRSPQSPTSTEELIEVKEKPLLNIGSKGDSFSLSVLKNISAIVEKRKKHQLSSSAPMQSVKAEEEKPADDGSSSTAQNISIPASETKKRPRSPQSPTSTEEPMEVKEEPLLTIGSKGDSLSFSLSVLKNISAILEQRKKWQISQQTSTSPTPMQSPEPEEEKPADDGSASADQDISVPAEEEMDRPPSPRSPTPEALIELKKMPLSAAIGSKGESFSLSVLKNISAIVEQRRKRQVPPRPPTPPAPMQSPKADDEEPADDDSAIAAQNISAPESETMRLSSPQSPTPSAELLPIMEAEAKADSFYLSVLQNIGVPDSETIRPSSPQSPTPSAELLMDDIDSKADSADSFSMSVLQNISVPASETMRPRSPQSPAPSAALLPIMEAIESKADAFSMSVLQNISVIVAERNRRQLSMLSTPSAPMQPVKAEDEQREKRQVPPQTSTPSAPTQSPKADDDEPAAEAGSSSATQNISVPVGEGIAPEPPTSTAASVKEPAPMNPADSVYAHVPHDLSNIPQLRGLKAGRRHGRLRKLHALNKIRERYGPMIDCFVPMVVESSAKHQSQHILISSALDHFANTVNHIADTHEGRDITNFTERLEAFKKRMLERCEKRRQRIQEASEEPQPPSPDISNEETLKRLRQETDAAVEALLTGDKSKEYPPDRFEELMKLFRDAYINTRPQ